MNSDPHVMNILKDDLFAKNLEEWNKSFVSF